jgi:chromate reductase
MQTVGVITGSLRKDSLTRKFAESLGRLADGRLEFRFIEIGDLPLYNEDLWADPPESVTRLKRDLGEVDAVLFVTPEYNRLFTPAIKNAIDWGSRPYGQSSWVGKPAAALGVTPGQLGGMAAAIALASQLSVVGCTVMGAPGVYFNYRPEMFAEDGTLIDESARTFLNIWIDSFTRTVAKAA